MLSISKEMVVYVACPAYNKTGGTELAHQLVYILKQNGVNSIILYYDYKEGNQSINPEFKKYVSEFCTLSQAQDIASNVLVAPEINIDLLDNFENIQKCVWWMSIDNYLKRDGFINAAKYFGYLKAARYAMKGNVTLHKHKLSNAMLHLYQSEYARQYLLKQGITYTHRLSDYINAIYLEKPFEISEKENNYVLYNPKKGAEFTKLLKEAAPDLAWKPIQNMTTEEVRNLLCKSKLYIDFGNHPGKDRFPREAAISGCCVITDKRGSAQYFEDIPIPDKYKFEDKKENIPDILNRIRDCLYNYNNVIKDFEPYRQFISNEYQTFIKDARDIFVER